MLANSSYRHTLRIYIILIALPQQQWLR